MTDPGREVPFSVNGKTYTLYAGNRALRLIERETGQPVLEAINRLQAVDITVMTALIWALLQQKHPEVSMEDTDELIDAHGYDGLIDVIQDAVERAFPEAKDAASPNVQTPGKPAGTGTNSSKARSRSASRSPSSGR